jgi:hypothetical protein
MSTSRRMGTLLPELFQGNFQLLSSNGFLKQNLAPVLANWPGLLPQTGAKLGQ